MVFYLITVYYKCFSYTRDFLQNIPQRYFKDFPFLSRILAPNPLLFCYNVSEVIEMAVSNVLKNDNTELLEKLQIENQLLLEENKKLNDTVCWMHDTIWRLVHIQRTEN